MMTVKTLALDKESKGSDMGVVFVDEIKSHPIIFNTEMIRAVLDGRKTQTRRVIKSPEKLNGLMLSGEESEWCPYGKPGDRLWVRETWSDESHPEWPHKCWYKAEHWEHVQPRWKPSIHMARKHSRITLEVTGVRVERVQDITREDSIKEGITYSDRLVSNSEGGIKEISKVEAFQNIWDSINIKRGFGWEVNPHVWVIEFKRVD